MKRWTETGMLDSCLVDQQRDEQIDAPDAWKWTQAGTTMADESEEEQQQG